jgi:methyl-accepting chemotaxis protein
MIMSADVAREALTEMNEKVQEVAKTSARTHEMSSLGLELATQSREGIDAISDAAGSVDDGIGRIHQELMSIEKIIKVVTDIATQTTCSPLMQLSKLHMLVIMGKGLQLSHEK